MAKGAWVMTEGATQMPAGSGAGIEVLRARRRGAWLASLWSAVVIGELVGKACAGDDAELGEHLAQVVVHRARGQEQLGGDLLVGQPFRNQPGDLQLLRCQLLHRGYIPLA